MWLKALISCGKIISDTRADDLGSDLGISIRPDECAQSLPGLWYLSWCERAGDWEFYLVDLQGELAHFIDDRSALAGRGVGAVWYGLMTEDNGGVLDGKRPDIEFLRGALCGDSRTFKVEELMIRLGGCRYFG